MRLEQHCTGEEGAGRAQTRRRFDQESVLVSNFKGAARFEFELPHEEEPFRPIFALESLKGFNFASFRKSKQNGKFGGY